MLIIWKYISRKPTEAGFNSEKRNQCNGSELLTTSMISIILKWALFGQYLQSDKVSPSRAWEPTLRVCFSLCAADFSLHCHPDHVCYGNRDRSILWRWGFWPVWFQCWWLGFRRSIELNPSKENLCVDWLLSRGRWSASFSSGMAKLLQEILPFSDEVHHGLTEQKASPMGNAKIQTIQETSKVGRRMVERHRKKRTQNVCTLGSRMVAIKGKKKAVWIERFTSG